MVRVTLVNGWHDDNKGDSAIVISTGVALKQHLGAVDFTIVSELPLETSEKQEFAYRHVKAELGDVRVVPRLLPSYTPSSGVKRYISAGMYFANLMQFGLRPHENPVARNIIGQSDFVISKGGHMLYSRRPWHPMDWSNLFAHLYPLLVAKQLGIPYAIWGHSLGPFADPLSRKMTSWILKDAKVVGVRETISYELAMKLGIDSKRLKLIPDPAFGIEPKHTLKVDNILKSKGLKPNAFLAVTVRQWTKVSTEKYRGYLLSLSDTIRRLIYEGFCDQVAIVIHTRGPIREENDCVASQELAKLLIGLPVVFVDEDLSPSELSAFYKQAKFVIGTRFHSVILALVAETPAYAISYFGPKSHGIMRDLGMQEMVIDLDEVSSSMMLQKLLSLDLTSFRKKIIAKVKYLKEKFLEETAWLVQEVLT